VATAEPGLRASAGPLLDVYDALFVDLDGVAYLGDDVIPAAPGAVAAARSAGVSLAFVTNNASRTPEQVASHLRALGLHAADSEVMTASVAAANHLAARLAPGAAVLVVGGEGITEALRQAGLRPVDSATPRPEAVLQGWAREVGWEMLAEACVVIRAGVAWYATNLDATLPSPRGPLPGNGSMVAALERATGTHPIPIGKPERGLFDAARELTGAQRPLMVGDRLETDIAGARAAGLDTLLVLSGVSTPADLLRAGPQSRPDYVGRDLSAVCRTHPAPSVVRVAEGARAVAGSVTIRVAAGRPPTIDPPADNDSDGHPVVGESDGHPVVGESDGLDGLRALCALVWSGAAEPDLAVPVLDDLDLDLR
jgi:HAD superfamily hydrolase (TIGR01457 family)